MMAITRNEAAVALSDIENTARRSGMLRGYQVGGRILMMWSVIWAVGYLAMALASARVWAPVWMGLDVVGVAGSLWLSRGAASHGAGVPGAGWRMLGGMLSVMAFVLAAFAVLQPTDPAAFLAFPGLLIGVIYLVVGFWQAPRFAIIGAAMFVITLVGFFAFKSWLAYWMAAASLALFVSGVWLWKR
jgi:hypothetical protein